MPNITLVTGASSDIGIALVRHLATSTDAPIILAHTNTGMARLDHLKAELNCDAIKILQADFSSHEEVTKLADRILSEFGVPNQVVHLPGLKLVYERFSKFNWDHFETDMNIQIRSAVILLRRLAPAMAKLESARIVFVLSSVTRGVPPKFMSMYVMIKYAQLGLMRALASEYSQTGICVNAVSPGMVETQFLDNIPKATQKMNAASVPRGRNATTADVVHGVDFLLSGRADFITGIELPITGGSSY